MKIGGIEKDIPIPEKGFKSKYPFHHMEINDSFFLTVEKDETPKQLGKRIIPSMSKYAKLHNCKFLSRTMENGVRLWRIE